MEIKNSIRKEMLLKRSSLSNEDQLKKSEAIFQNICQSGYLSSADFILNYADFRAEVKTQFYFQYAIEHEIPIFYPKVEGEDLKFFQIIQTEELKTGYQSILEPSVQDKDKSLESFLKSNSNKKGIVLLPGSVFSRNMVRYGYGKGFYDRFLTQHSKLKKIGLCYEIQLLDQLKKEAHDILMDAIVTESGMIKR